jgi:hypothetical protein
MTSAAEPGELGAPHARPTHTHTHTHTHRPTRAAATPRHHKPVNQSIPHFADALDLPVVC